MKYEGTAIKAGRNNARIFDEIMYGMINPNIIE